MTDLPDLLGIRHGDLVCFVGAGGKSTLLLGSGAALAERGNSVVMTTTTKMGVNQIPGWATVCRSLPEVESALEDRNPVFLVGDTTDQKVVGVSPEFADEVLGVVAPGCLLAEADGARGRMVKAPASHEPVIPTRTTLVIAVASWAAVGRQIDEVAHRPERVATLLGREVSHVLTAEDIGRVLSSPEGGRRGVPGNARFVVAITGVDAETGDAISRGLDTDGIDRVVILDVHEG